MAAAGRVVRQGNRRYKIPYALNRKMLFSDVTKQVGAWIRRFVATSRGGGIAQPSFDLMSQVWELTPVGRSWQELAAVGSELSGQESVGTKLMHALDRKFLFSDVVGARIRRFVATSRGSEIAQQTFDLMSQISGVDTSWQELARVGSSWQRVVRSGKLWSQVYKQS